MAINLHGNGTYPKYHPCMKWYIYPYMNGWSFEWYMYVGKAIPAIHGWYGDRICNKKTQIQPGENHIPCKVFLLRSLHLKGPFDMISLLHIISSISKWVN